MRFTFLYSIQKCYREEKVNQVPIYYHVTIF